MTRRGIKESWGHKGNYGKIDAFKAVPEIIQHGKLIDAQNNWKDRGYDTVVLAAPIKIGEVDYYAAVVIKRIKSNDIQRYYLHDVLAIEKEQLAKAQADKRTPESDTAPIYNLLQQLNNVNSLSEKDIVSDEGQFQLKDETQKLRKQLSAEKALSEKLRAEFKRSKYITPDPKQTGKAVTQMIDSYLGKRNPALHQSIMEDINKLYAEMRKKEENWFNVHDLMAIKKEQTAQDQAVERTPGSKSAPLYNLLQQLNNVNSLSEKDIVSDEGVNSQSKFRTGIWCGI